MILYLKFGPVPEYLAALTLFSGLVAIALIDWEHGIIPDQINLALAVVGVPLLLLQSSHALLNGLLGALLGGGLLLLVAVVSRGGMGGGDIKLAAVLGLYLGWVNVLLVLFMAFLIGAAVGLTWVWAGKKTLKQTLPFGPFLSVSTFIVLLWGSEIISWYRGMF